MSRVNVTTNTPLVTAVCYDVPTTTTTDTIAPTPMALAAVLGKHDVILLPSLIPRDTISSTVDLTMCHKSNFSPIIPSKAYANYAASPPQVSLLFTL